MSTYIERVFASNYRQYDELDVTFNSSFNFVTGPNGAGKTSVLAAICHCFNQMSFAYSRFRDDGEVWINYTSADRKYKLGFGAGSIYVGEYRKGHVRAWAQPAPEEGRTNVHGGPETYDFAPPLFIGSNRSIKYQALQGMSRDGTLQENRNGYVYSSADVLYSHRDNSLKQWLVNRYFIVDKDWAVEERENWEHLIRSLPAIAPFDSNLAYVRTGRDLEPVFSLYGDECYLEELSSGFQAVLIIIANIFEWVENTNSPGQRRVVDAEGSVLIDELDVHLHPEWQMTLRNGLRTIFPRLQFIVTTHSPHLLASAEVGEVIVLPREVGRKVVRVTPTQRTYSGWSTDQILTDLMDVRSLENKDYERLISVAADAAHRQDVGGLEQALASLENVSHPDDTITVVLRARLAKLKVVE